jgi:hypothetical protein
MHWRKLGLLYAPDGRQTWARSHAMLPTPLAISDQILRIYVSHLDGEGIGRVGYLDIAFSDPTRPLRVAGEPVLDIGEPGAFDDNGVVPSCVVPAADRSHMYYYGFQLQTKIPYTTFAGLAASVDSDGPFNRLSRAPILDRTDEELYIRSAPFVLREGDKWRMWYVGGGKWLRTNEKALPLYSVRHVESVDGICWSSSSVECLTPRSPEEIGFGRPFVVHDGASYRMWYSIRTVGGYRIGYATSTDGLDWTRQDEKAGIERSQSGWDSEMICFPAVVPTADKWLMLYNGNGYGRTGVGVAVAHPD